MSEVFVSLTPPPGPLPLPNITFVKYFKPADFQKIEIYQKKHVICDILTPFQPGAGAGMHHNNAVVDGFHLCDSLPG